MNFISEIQQFPIRIDIPVQWGDMDAANHVNNLNYLRWTESSRIEFFRKFDIGVACQKGIAPILAWQDCKYIFPLTFPDTAIIVSGVNEIGQDHFILESRVYSAVHERIAVISMQKMVAYDYQLLKKIELPQVWVDGLGKAKSEVAG